MSFALIVWPNGQLRAREPKTESIESIVSLLLDVYLNYWILLFTDQSVITIQIVSRSDDTIIATILAFGDRAEHSFHSLDCERLDRESHQYC